MKFTPVTLGSALVVIGAAGFLVGRISAPAADADAAAAALAEERASSRSSLRAGGLGGGDGETRRARAGAGGREIAGRATAGDAEARAAERRAKIEAILRGENALDRNRALLQFIDQLAPDEFADAISHFRSLGITDGRMGEYSLLLTAWAKADPLAALEYSVANTGGNFATSTILATWAASDPEAAVRWAEANHEGDGPNRHLIGIIRGIAETDPARATELMASMPRSEERGAALDAMMPHILRQGPEASRAWASAIGDDALRNGAMTRLAERLASVDPAGTADWLMANPGEATDRRMDDVFMAWNQKDPGAAYSALNSLPAGDVRTNALRGIVRSVATQDPQQAVALMNRYPNDINDRVVQDFAWHSFRSAPALVADQIARIGNEGSRDWMYRRMLDNWVERDPAAATNWISRNALPQSVVDHLNRQQQERQQRQQ